jgi:hypothetical protein
LLPAGGLSPNAFSIKLLFRPSIPDNITNWGVFDDDQKIINFLHMEDTFQDAIVNESTHDENLQDFTVIFDPRSPESPSELVKSIPKFVVILEKFYDLYENFRGVFNCKTNSSSLLYETVNIGTRTVLKISVWEKGVMNKKSLLL